jgi:hypothetical protein
MFSSTVIRTLSKVEVAILAPSSPVAKTYATSF